MTQPNNTPEAPDEVLFSFYKHREFLFSACQNPKRQSGRSLAYAFSHIAMAITNHDKPVPVRDHPKDSGKPASDHANNLLLEQIILIVKAMKLEGFSFALQPHAAMIFKLPFPEPKIQRVNS